jgi:hypothetical protein
MFQKAIKEVSKYTKPVIVSKRLYSGIVESGCAAFFIVNEDGWVITAAHVMTDYHVFHHKHQKEIAQHKKQIRNIENDSNLNAKQKKKEIRRLKSNNQWITNISYWWLQDGVQIAEYALDGFLDIAVVRLEPFDKSQFRHYATFRNPSKKVEQGTSLCRLGYPFHQIQSRFIEGSNNFELAPGTLPVPRFPMDGILTRYANFVDQSSGKQAKYIETSTHGLRGQSGGPIFDINGHVCGVQSRTIHLSLGFGPKIKVGNKETVENQFLNVGLGLYVEDVLKFLDENKVKYKIAT